MTQNKSVLLIEKRFYPLVRILDKVSWIALFVMMTMTAIDLLLRNFTNLSILGANELTELLMVIIVFCSLAQCETADGHIRVELVMDKFGPGVRKIADMFTQTLAAVLFTFMSLSMFKHASNMKSYGEVTMDLAIPIYPFVYIACMGCVIITLVLISKTIINIIKAVKS